MYPEDKMKRFISLCSAANLNWKKVALNVPKHRLLSECGDLWLKGIMSDQRFQGCLTNLNVAVGYRWSNGKVK